MTTATETQSTTKFNRHAAATKLFFDCGHAELKPLDATEYRHVSVAGQCTACRHVASSSAITLSNFRVVYHAPRYEDGKVLYDGYCAILADDAALDGAEVRVFDVPDVDEGQLAAALFACDAMNRYRQMASALRAIDKAFADGDLNWKRKRYADSDPYHPANTQLCAAMELIDATTTSK